ncbi:MAG: hypothetical protein NPMRTH1_760030 [Nitrosopumilales archaeon]|nr:MAG: hypothetical protein NPMRTH1_760030 [Nitrosopumilales archaeon]
MARKKKQDPRITIAIIAAIGAIGAAFVGGPFINTLWEDRPIVYLSLGWENEYPKEGLQTDEIGYYVDIVVWNEGKTAGETIFVASSSDAQIRLGKTSSWSYEQSLPFTVLPETSLHTYPIYVLPEENTDTFSIVFSVEEHNEAPLFQKLTIFRPTMLTFENQGGAYKLIERDEINIVTGE